MNTLIRIPDTQFNIHVLVQEQSLGYACDNVVAGYYRGTRSEIYVTQYYIDERNCLTDEAYIGEPGRYPKLREFNSTSAYNLEKAKRISNQYGNCIKKFAAAESLMVKLENDQNWISDIEIEENDNATRLLYLIRNSNYVEYSLVYRGANYPNITFSGQYYKPTLMKMYEAFNRVDSDESLSYDDRVKILRTLSDDGTNAY